MKVKIEEKIGHIVIMKGETSKRLAFCMHVLSCNTMIVHGHALVLIILISNGQIHGYLYTVSLAYKHYIYLFPILFHAD